MDATVGARLPVQNIGEKLVRSKHRQVQPFDVRILTLKLEAAKQERDAAKQRRKTRQAFTQHGYVPQNAAAQHLTTTLSVKGRSASGKQHDSAAHVVAHVEPRTFAADEVVHAKSSRHSQPAAPHSHSKARKSSPKTSPERDPAKVSDNIPRRSISRRRSADDVKKAQTKHQQQLNSIRHSEAISSCAIVEDEDEPKVKRSASMRGYQPGDAAARRRFESTAKRRTSALVDHSSTAHTLDLSVLVEDDRGQPLDFAHRPSLDPHDRPHWAQRSECGDSMRHLLNLPLMQKKDKAHAAQEEAKKTMMGSSSSSGAAAARNVRKRSVGDLPENLVNAAAARIKQEKRAGRRQSMIMFFKKS